MHKQRWRPHLTRCWGKHSTNFRDHVRAWRAMISRTLYRILWSTTRIFGRKRIIVLCFQFRLFAKVRCRQRFRARPGKWSIDNLVAPRTNPPSMTVYPPRIKTECYSVIRVLAWTSSVELRWQLLDSKTRLMRTSNRPFLAPVRVCQLYGLKSLWRNHIN